MARERERKERYVERKKKKTKWENMPLLLLPHHLTLNSKSASAMCRLILVLEGPSPSLSVIERPTDVASVKRSSTESGPPQQSCHKWLIKESHGRDAKWGYCEGTTDCWIVIALS